MSTDNVEIDVRDAEDAIDILEKPVKKLPIPYAERNPKGRPKGREVGPRKPYIKFHARKQKEFLKAYQKTGSKAKACDMTNVSRGTVYYEAKKNPVFKEALEKVEDSLAGTLEETLYMRVVEGEKTIVKDGDGNVLTETTKPSSPSLALKVASKYSDRYASEEGSGISSQAGEALAKLAAALGLSVDADKIVEAQQRAKEKEIEGELISKED